MSKLNFMDGNGVINTIDLSKLGIIDDENVSTDSVFSSSKISNLLLNYLTKNYLDSLIEVKKVRETYFLKIKNIVIVFNFSLYASSPYKPITKRSCLIHGTVEYKGTGNLSGSSGSTTYYISVDTSGSFRGNTDESKFDITSYKTPQITAYSLD